MIICPVLYCLISGSVCVKVLWQLLDLPKCLVLTVFSVVICHKVHLLIQVEAAHWLYLSGLHCQTNAQVWVHFCSLDWCKASLSCETHCFLYIRVFLMFILIEHSNYYYFTCSWYACGSVYVPNHHLHRSSQAKMVVDFHSFAQMQAVTGSSGPEKQ